MWNIFKKSKEQQIEDNKSVIIDEEFGNLRIKADVEAYKIFVQIYCLFKERINELKEGDNFILFQEEPIKICDNKELNDSLICKALYDTNKHVCNRIPELRIVKDIENFTKKYYVYAIKEPHDDVVEIYDIRFRVQPSPQEINNGNEICVTIYAINKTIYKIISPK